ncbi:MAG: hypothetical protein ACFCVF_11750 [Kineosporiaceae bacterium]
MTPPRPPRPVRYRGFVLTGLAVGVIVAVIVWAVGTQDPRYPPLAALGYLAALLGLIGAVLGGTAGVVVETVQAHRHRGRTTRGR